MVRDRGNAYVLRRKIEGIHWDEAMEQLQGNPDLKGMSKEMKVDKLAAGILAHPQLGVRLAKQFVNRDQGAPGQAESIEATALLFTSDEHKHSVRRFLDGDRKSGDS